MRRLTGASMFQDDAAADAETPSEDGPAVTPTPASLLTGDVRAALRLLAPFLVAGGATGYAARLPYDLDLR